ncbi:MAG: nucleotidyltransferase family protein [Terrimicrobiaceae bacterium]
MPHATSGFRAIILAAGQSSRMGSDKSRLPWIEGKPLLSWMVETLSAAGWQTSAVLGPQSYTSWNSSLPARCAVLNPDPARGKTSSLVCGMETLSPDTKWILITAVDQPRLPALYQRLREEAETSRAKIIVPTREGSRGHPVVLSGALRDELAALQETSQGLRGLLDAYRSETDRLPDGDTEDQQWDINTPANYQDALAFFQNPSTINPQPSTAPSA